MAAESRREPYTKPLAAPWSFVISSRLSEELFDLLDAGKTPDRIRQDIERVFVMWEVRHGGQGPG